MRPNLFERDLTRHLFIVTGTHAGIGLQTTRQRIRQGSQVITACRRTGEAQTCADALATEVPGAPIVVHLDLGDLASVRRFAAEVLERFERIDARVNNAG